MIFEGLRSIMFFEFTPEEQGLFEYIASMWPIEEFPALNSRFSYSSYFTVVYSEIPSFLPEHDCLFCVKILNDASGDEEYQVTTKNGFTDLILFLHKKYRKTTKWRLQGF